MHPGKSGTIHTQIIAKQVFRSSRPKDKTPLLCGESTHKEVGVFAAVQNEMKSHLEKRRRGTPFYKGDPGVSRELLVRRPYNFAVRGLQYMTSALEGEVMEKLRM